MFKRLLATLLVVLMVVGAVVTASAASQFTDVPAGSLQDTPIQVLTSIGTIKGFTATSFGGDQLVQRQQMALFIARLRSTIPSMFDTLQSNTTGFPDLVDSTYFNAINYCNDNDIINGYPDGTFQPTGNVTYEEAVKMCVTALGYTGMAYPYGYMTVAKSLNTVVGNTTLPDGLLTNMDAAGAVMGQALTRNQVAILLYNTLLADMHETYNYIYYTQGANNVQIQNTASMPKTLALNYYGFQQINGQVVSTFDWNMTNTGVGKATWSTGMIVYNYASKSAVDWVDFGSLGLTGSPDDYFGCDISYIKIGNTNPIYVAVNVNGNKQTFTSATLASNGTTFSFGNYTFDYSLISQSSATSPNGLSQWYNNPVGFYSAGAAGSYSPDADAYVNNPNGVFGASSASGAAGMLYNFSTQAYKIVYIDNSKNNNDQTPNFALYVPYYFGKVSSFGTSPNTVTFVDGNGNYVTYSSDPTATNGFVHYNVGTAQAGNYVLYTADTKSSTFSIDQVLTARQVNLYQANQTSNAYIFSDANTTPYNLASYPTAPAPLVDNNGAQKAIPTVYNQTSDLVTFNNLVLYFGVNGGSWTPSNFGYITYTASTQQANGSTAWAAAGLVHPMTVVDKSGSPLNINVSQVMVQTGVTNTGTTASPVWKNTYLGDGNTTGLGWSGSTPMYTNSAATTVGTTSTKDWWADTTTGGNDGYTYFPGLACLFTANTDGTYTVTAITGSQYADTNNTLLNVNYLTTWSGTALTPATPSISAISSNNTYQFTGAALTPPASSWISGATASTGYFFFDTFSNMVVSYADKTVVNTASALAPTVTPNAATPAINATNGVVMTVASPFVIKSLAFAYVNGTGNAPANAVAASGQTILVTSYFERQNAGTPSNSDYYVNGYDLSTGSAVNGQLVVSNQTAMTKPVLGGSGAVDPCAPGSVIALTNGAYAEVGTVYANADSTKWPSSWNGSTTLPTAYKQIISGNTCITVSVPSATSNTAAGSYVLPANVPVFNWALGANTFTQDPTNLNNNTFQEVVFGINITTGVVSFVVTISA